MDMIIFVIESSVNDYFMTRVPLLYICRYRLFILMLPAIFILISGRQHEYPLTSFLKLIEISCGSQGQDYEVLQSILLTQQTSIQICQDGESGIILMH